MIHRVDWSPKGRRPRSPRSFWFEWVACVIHFTCARGVRFICNVFKWTSAGKRSTNAEGTPTGYVEDTLPVSARCRFRCWTRGFFFHYYFCFNSFFFFLLHRATLVPQRFRGVVSRNLALLMCVCVYIQSYELNKMVVANITTFTTQKDMTFNIHFVVWRMYYNGCFIPIFYTISNT